LFGKSALPSGVQGETLTLKISGMFCSACAVGVEKSLDKVPGVQAASVNFDKEEATLVVGPGGVDRDAVLNAVKSAGPYSAHVKEDRP
ncbi:MAG: cation transporter, partial [bacterium]|nr:cation transporter [bacterium]